MGRNEPCPCGSGKKFKRCCSRPPLLAPVQPRVILARNLLVKSKATATK